MPDRFTLTVHATPRHWLTVAVYDTEAQMRAAAHKHRPHSGVAKDALACFQVSDRATSRYLGIMRLSRTHLTPDVVIHESVHAAVAYVAKSLHLKRIHLDPHSSTPGVDMHAEREESLAYSVHGIASALLSELGLCA